MLSHPGAAPNIGGQYSKLKKALSEMERRRRERENQEKVKELPKRSGGYKWVVLWLLAEAFSPKNHRLPETRWECQPG